MPKLPSARHDPTERHRWGRPTIPAIRGTVVVVLVWLIGIAAAGPGDADSFAWRGTAEIAFHTAELERMGLKAHVRGFADHDAGTRRSRSEVSVSADWRVEVDDWGYPTARGSFQLEGAVLWNGRGRRDVVGNLRFASTGKGAWPVTDQLAGDDRDGPVMMLSPRSTEFRAATGRYRLDGEMALSASWAQRFGVPELAARTVAHLVVTLERTPVRRDGQPYVGDGAVPRDVSPMSVTSTAAAGIIGPDVIVGDLYQIANYGVVGTKAAFSVGTISCNAGDEPIPWIATTNEHPVIAQNMYRLKDGRFEQIGMSWLKHGFFAVSGGLCFSDCRGTDGSALGVHCSDPYSANLNGTQPNLGPRSEVDAFTGSFPFPPGGPVFSGTLSRRLQVDVDDLDQSLNFGAQYFVESQYVTPDDAQAGNQDNNNSYRPITVSGAGTAINVEIAGVTRRTKPAISAWRVHEPEVLEQSVRVPGEGLFILAGKATDLGDGYWSYEYAVQNINSHRSAGWFRVPIAPTAIVRNTGFHDVHYHSGEPYDDGDWNVSRSAVALTWATTPFETWPDANALRWGSLYNFRFEADVPPESSSATIGLFRPGIPDRVDATMVGPVTNASDCNGNDIPDSTDIVDGTSADCNENGTPDECESHRPMAVLIASGLVDPVAATTAPDDSSLVYVAERGGAIRVIEAGVTLPTPFLDLTGALSTGAQQGVLDLAFDPDFAATGRFFVSYVDLGGSTIVMQFTATASRFEADAGSGTMLKTIAQPFADRNGGALAFGPAGFLFVGMGDGGGVNDPLNRAQEPGTLLGKVLRLDIDNPPTYVPPSNPFFNTVLPLDEIWSIGVREPRGLSFDHDTGDLYVADHGSGTSEELNIEPGASAGGLNLGWRCMEGAACTGLTGCACNDPGLSLPAVTFSGGPGACGIIGGLVYRGCDLTDWLGAYFYADTCNNTFQTLRYVDGQVANEADISAMIEAATGSITGVSAFGETAEGEVLFAAATGQVYQVVSNPAVCGDEVIEPGEGCDDGNAESGDGCAPDCSLEPAAANNVCDAALSIAEGLWAVNTLNATTDGPDEPLVCDENGQTGIDNDVWYMYTPTCGGFATVSLCDADFDTRVGVYALGTCPQESGTVHACNDDACGVGSHLSFDVEPCAPYLLRIGGTAGESGTGSLSVQCTPEPLLDDCNGNLVNDYVDIACQTSTDGNANDIPDECETTGDALLGGRLYDRWWEEIGAPTPAADHPLWNFRPDPVSNVRTGADTWRCKECHGWDYKGVDGQYGSGSHRTGIPGILGTTMESVELFDLLKEPPSNDGGPGVMNGHDYGAVMSDVRINDLVAFVLAGAIDDTAYIDDATGVFDGDQVAGEFNYQFGGTPSCTVCHGADGATINFGTAQDPEYVGTIANANPWELLHKIRFGQPAAPMPSWLGGGGANQGAADIGRYAQIGLVRECTVDEQCDDGIECTLNVCDVEGACVFVPDDLACVDDGNYCNGPERCAPEIGCFSAGNPCTGGCDEVAGCACTAPTVAAAGCRYLAITPQPSGDEALQALALRPACGTGSFLYAGSPSGALNVAPLVASRTEAAFLSPSEWGETVYVFGPDIVPETMYEVRADCGTVEPVLTGPIDAATGQWGDVIGAYAEGEATPPDGVVDFRDIGGVVDSFLDAPGGPSVYRADLFGCLPEQVVDFADIAAVVAAFKGDTYEQASLCAIPCNE